MTYIEAVIMIVQAGQAIIFTNIICRIHEHMGTLKRDIEKLKSDSELEQRG